MVGDYAGWLLDFDSAAWVAGWGLDAGCVAWVDAEVGVAATGRFRAGVVAFVVFAFWFWWGRRADAAWVSFTS